jgi:hypothetical protein
VRLVVGHDGAAARGVGAFGHEASGWRESTRRIVPVTFGIVKQDKGFAGLTPFRDTD